VRPCIKIKVNKRGRGEKREEKRSHLQAAIDRIDLLDTILDSQIYILLITLLGCTDTFLVEDKDKSRGSATYSFMKSAEMKITYSL
jgi:hypothetical protein